MGLLGGSGDGVKQVLSRVMSLPQLTLTPP